MSLRLFVAVVPPAAVREEARRAADHLRSTLPGLKARFADPHATHLTLLFLGRVPAVERSTVERRLSEALHRAAPLVVATAGLGAFPSVRRPSVVWLGIDDRDARLTALQAVVGRALAGVAPGDRDPRFVPHLTLARIAERDHQRRAQLAAALGAFRPAPATWRVEEVALFRSELLPDGARHHVLARWPLTGTA